MAAYPPGPSRLAALSNYGANSAPTDRMYIVSAAVGFTAGAASDRYITPNDFLAEITRNITDLTVQFGDGVDGTVSAAGKGKLRWNATAGSFQVSENTAAYQNLLKGSGVATRVAFWSATDELSSNSDFYWDNVNERLGVGVGSTPDAPLDVLADGTALAQQWRQNAGPLRMQVILDNVPEASIGTSTNHTLHLLSNNLQRLTVENSGRVGINRASVVQAQLQVVALDATTKPLILNSAATPSVSLAEFYNDSSLRFLFSPAANLSIGLSGAGGATGSITLNGVTSGAVGVTVAAAAGTWALQLPTSGGSANQFLQTNGAGVTTWATAITGAAAPAASVQFNDGTNGFDGDPDFLWDTATGTLQLGVAVSRTGKLQLRSIVSGSVTHTVGTPSAAHVIAWPDALPAPNQVLTAGAVAGNNVTLSWTTPSSGGTPGAPLNSVQFNSASAFAGNAGLLYIPSSTTGNELQLTSATITSGNLFSIAMTGVGAAGNTKTALSIISSGANGTAGQTVTGATIAVTNTNATSGTNVALTLTASGATTANTALNVTAGQALFPSGTVALPAVAVGNPGTGLYSNGGLLNITISGASYIEIWGGGQVTIRDTTALAWGSNGVNSADLYMRRRGAANLAFGAADVAAPVAQTMSVQNVVAGTSNTAGVNWTFVGSRGTGNAAGGSFIWQTAAAGVSGSSQNASAQVMSLNSDGQLVIAPSTASATGSLTVLPNNAATNSIVTVARLGVNSTGTAADGFGAALSWSAETSTTNDTETARNNVFWTTATHASRTSATSWSLANNATLAEVMRLGTPSNNVGSPFVLSIHDGTNPNVWTSGSFAAKLYLISPTLPAVGVAAHFSATSIDAPQWQLLRGRGTTASPTAVQATDSLGNIEWWGQTSTSTNNVVAGARIRVSTTENWSAGNNGCQMIFFVSNNAGTITERMSLAQTGTLRIGATSGTVSTDNKLQIGNYSSWNADAVAAIYTGANDDKGLEIIGTAAQTADLFRCYLDSVTPDKLTLTAGGRLTTHWLNWNGEARVTTQFDKTSDTTLANVTGLSITVVAGRTYSFKAVLYTTSNVAGGVKAAIGGTATATAIRYEALTFDNSTLAAQTRATALGTAVGAATTVTAAQIVITGTITVNAGGTLTVQFAQNVSNGTASSVLTGSVFIADDVP